MTTDNRTNEPTEVQVEAAAKAIEKIPHIVWNSPTRQDAMTLARAALVAAAGAAPQAEQCCQHPKCPGGSICCCAPALTSSTVDEDALAEVIGSLGWGYMVDGPSMGEIARAVVEWMKGQGR